MLLSPVRSLIAVVAFAASTGCARTSVSSMSAREIRGRHFDRILVVFPLTDLGARKTAEDAFSSAGSRARTLFVPSYTLFLPGRQYTNDEVGALLSEEHIDGMLVISLDGSGVSTTRTATSSSTAQCTAWTSSQGCMQASSTTVSGGYDISKPWATFGAQLLDGATGTPVWTASARSRGNAFAGYETLLRSMARRTVDKLRADHVVQ